MQLQAKQNLPALVLNYYGFNDYWEKSKNKKRKKHISA